MHRVFGERIPEIETDSEKKFLFTSEDLLLWIRENEIGNDVVIETPFGRRYAIYCDYTASARAIRPIEEYILENVLPLYGNTHSSVPVSSEQTTLFVHEARQEIRSMTGAGDGDNVIFTGSGTTAAVELLIHLMQPERLVVISSIHEHHSNLLPWRFISEASYLVRESCDGGIDADDLVRVINEARVAHPQSQLLAAFTACSNITGVCMNVPQITSILKRYNTLSVWDYASSAPYVEIEVNGVHPIDAVFFSGHKFIGGVSTPGVLVVKKSLIKAKVPKRIGGGTVFFVSPKGEWYLKDAEYREEGGTPDSVGIIRLALAVKLKRAVGEHAIGAQEVQKTERFLKGLKDCCNVTVLGVPAIRGRLAVFSFLIKDWISGLFFHHNYISALLNDLFGIQSRAGCMCAGPYAQYLMGIDEQMALQYFSALKESDELDRTHLRRVGEYSSNEVLRPGFTRISVPYFWTDKQVKVIVQRDTSQPVPMNSSIAEAHRLADESLAIIKKVVERSRSVNISYPLAPFRPLAYVYEVACIEKSLEPFQVRNLPKDVRITSQYHPRIRIERAGIAEISVIIFFGPVFQLLFLAHAFGGCDMFHFLDSGERMRDRLEDIDMDDEMQSLKMLDIWDKRVVVHSQQLSVAEEAKIPWHSPPVEMYKRVCEAIHGLGMIKEGDKVLVCLSGGKDSLSLLHILHFYQMRCRKNKSTNFKLGAITVDPGSSAYNPRPLVDYCRSLNIDYFYEEQGFIDIIGAAKKLKNLRSICAYCSRMKRGRLAAAARLHGWNVLAMGQHMDDVAESFFIAAFQNGNLSTMKAQYQTRDGTLRVIRPLVFVRERALREFAESRGLPVIAENCPACFTQATERHRMKQLLAQQELIFPDLFNSLRSALRPLLLVDSARTDEMRAMAIENIVKFSKGKA
ncbi:hypothetical protein Angca_006790, partial [Angiostrongylus cantonensis]